MIDGFLADLVKQLRATIYEATTDILATMSKNQGKLHPRSVVQLRNLIDQVGQMNFFGDTETDAMIRRVRSIFDQRPETRNVADLQIPLRDVAIITRASLLDLGEQPRASGSLATRTRRRPRSPSPAAGWTSGPRPNGDPPITLRSKCRPAGAWKKVILSTKNSFTNSSNSESTPAQPAKSRAASPMRT